MTGPLELHQRISQSNSKEQLISAKIRTRFLSDFEIGSEESIRNKASRAQLTSVWENIEKAILVWNMVPPILVLVEQW